MTPLEKAILRELSALPKEKQADVLTYIRFVKFSLSDSAEIEKNSTSHGSGFRRAQRS